MPTSGIELLNLREFLEKCKEETDVDCDLSINMVNSLAKAGTS